ncbi:MAG: hypothetical protein MZV49_20900 [Rhodopseudomonas palustris]|nr:hypothetical protein [Rhodopseudomonas palustris]
MRLARETFLEVLGGDAAILPRIVALGDIDEDELAFAEQTAAIGGAATLELPPTLSELDRRLALAMLVGPGPSSSTPPISLAAPLVVSSPASAIALATELARLMDDMATRDVDWKRLDGLVPDALDRYWQLTLDFLKIARDWWPRYLAEIGCIEPVVRHNRLLTAEMERLRAQPSGPVIAAGSTGSMPTTARFLPRSPRCRRARWCCRGLIPNSMTTPGARSAAPARRADDPNPAPPCLNHPQFALFQLLNTFGITRADVRPLGAAVSHARKRCCRRRCAIEAPRRALASPAAADADRRADRRRDADADGDRRGQCRAGSAGDRGGDARELCAGSQRRAGDAGPCAGAARGGRARPLAIAVRRFRR